MTLSHAAKCVLSRYCAKAGSHACAPTCAAYIAMSGFTGGGGRIANANVPKSYRNVTLATSPAREEQRAAYGLIAEYVATFTRMFEDGAEPIKSLYLHSSAPGTGKTTTAAAILIEWIAVHYIGSMRRGIAPLERPAYFLDVNAWQADYNEFNRPRVPEEIAEPAAARFYRNQTRAMAAPFAVLDDIGVRDMTEGFRADLHRLINTRVTTGLPTVYTSNVKLADLGGVFGERPARLADRVRDLCFEVAFLGESKRGMR